MAIVKRASGSWKSVTATLWTKGIKAEDLSKLPDILNNQKKVYDDAVKVFEKENAELKASFNGAIAAFSSGHEARLLAIQGKFAQKIKIADDKLTFSQEQIRKLRQKNFLTQLLNLKTILGLWRKQNSLKSKRNKLAQQRDGEIKTQNELYERKKQKMHTKNAEYQSEIEGKVKRAKDGLDAIEATLKSGAYYGALAEVKMIELLSKLPDNYYVINDVTLKLNKSVRFDNAWLSSAQIDHLVIGPAGVFVIEVKNWSKQFSEEGDFFSPYQQVKRHNYVCYTLLSKIVRTTVRSIVACAGHLPEKPDSSYAKVLSLEQVNGYILWFKDTKHDEATVQRMAEFIESNIEYVNR
jgi:hypothetical protein